MAKGRVTSFNPNTGYGFIKNDETGEDGIFVYQKDINMRGFRYLKPGDVVEYERTDGDRGPKATNVTVVKRAQNKRSNRKPSSVSDDKLNRLLEVLSSSNDDMEPLITEDDVDYIKNG